MNSPGWPAPAKLNLMLHVTGRRRDGYHLLQTVFQLLDFGDMLDFNVRDDGSIRRSSHCNEVAEADDLAVRAARCLQRISGCHYGVDIRIKKKLPLGGGLGGASSDAATTLVALNRLWRLNYSIERLSLIGLELGADVPIFIHGYTAWAEGVGERLSPIKLRHRWYLIIQPDCHVATAKIFSAPDLTRNTPAIRMCDFLKDGGHNDCEPVVKKMYPKVTEALDWLQQFASATMTGTGACVFAGFDSRERAQSICVKIPKIWKGFLAKGVNESPLYTRLKRMTKQKNCA